MKKLIFCLYIGLLTVLQGCKKDPEISKPELPKAELIVENSFVFDMHVSSNELYFLKSTGELGIYDRNFKSFKFFNSLNSQIDAEAIFAIDRTISGQVVFGDSINGIRYFNNETLATLLSAKFLRFFNFKRQPAYFTNEPFIDILNKPHNLPSWVTGANKTNCLAALNDELVIGTEAGHIGIFNKYNSTLTLKLDRSFTEGDSAITGECLSMEFDDNDNLWTMTSKGLVRYDHKQWKYLEGPINTDFRHLLIRKNGIYTITDRGIYQVSENQLIYNSQLSELFPTGSIRLAEEDPDGNLFVVTDSGVFQIKE